MPPDATPHDPTPPDSDPLSPIDREIMRMEAEDDSRRAPIAPDFEEEQEPLPGDVVGSQAWGRQHLQEEAPPSGDSSRLWRQARTSFKFMAVAFLAAVLVATIFSYWTPDESLSPEFVAQMRVVNSTPDPLSLQATPLPTEATTKRVGIIAGHSGPPRDASFEVDPGAICDDNNDGSPELTELQINTEVAQKVVNELLTYGYEVDLLEEFDPRLHDYRADALLSIHTNDCQNYGLGATGYNVAGPISRGSLRGADEALVRCVIDEYGRQTGLPRHFGLTEDMTSYHTFREVSIDTPVAIIEMGFMFIDRQFLTQNQDQIAAGIVQGLRCFLEPQTFLDEQADEAASPEATPSVTPLPSP